MTDENYWKKNYHLIAVEIVSLASVLPINTM